MDAEIKYKQAQIESIDKLLKYFLSRPSKDLTESGYEEYFITYSDLEPFNDIQTLYNSMNSIHDFFSNDERAILKLLFKKNSNPEQEYRENYINGEVESWAYTPACIITVKKGFDILAEIKNINVNLLVTDSSVGNYVDENSFSRIKKITFVREGNRKSDPTKIFYVNDDIENVRKIKTVSKAIRGLIKIAEGQKVEFDSYIIDYINFNKSCVIYCNKKYELTDILVSSKGKLIPNDNICLEVIMKNKYLLSKNNT